MKKHILVVTQYFFPEQFRINDICKELVELGYKVTVLTGIPNYPIGHFFDGYGLLKKRKERWNGIDIVRIPIISRGKTPIRLILNYYSFVVSGWFWSHFTKINADVVFSFEVSPMIQTLVGMWYSERKRIDHILYVQDLWPDNLEVVGGVHNKLILNHYKRLSERVYEHCTSILATSPSFVDEIGERVKNRIEIDYLPQYAEDFYRPSSFKSGLIPPDERLKVVFTGNIGFAQGLELLPKVAPLVDNVCFVIVGEGRYKDKLIEETKNVKDKFIFLGSQPPEKIPSILAACDVAYVSFMNNQLFEKTIPAKLQSYLACGMPILASASGEVKRIIAEANCGICCKIGEVEELVNGIKFFQNCDFVKMSNNSLKYYNNNFDKKMVMKKLDDIFSNVRNE